MHTYIGPNGTRFHYNSDLSGEVLIDITFKDIFGNGFTHDAMPIPGEDLLAFIKQVMPNESIDHEKNVLP